jgi:hypothetical protein
VLHCFFQGPSSHAGGQQAPQLMLLLLPVLLLLHQLHLLFPLRLQLLLWWRQLLPRLLLLL